MNSKQKPLYFYNFLVSEHKNLFQLNQIKIIKPYKFSGIEKLNQTKLKFI